MKDLFTYTFILIFIKIIIYNVSWVRDIFYLTFLNCWYLLLVQHTNFIFLRIERWNYDIEMIEQVNK